MMEMYTSPAEATDDVTTKATPSADEQKQHLRSTGKKALQRQLLVLSVLASALLLACVLDIVIASPASGYEISIYDAVPVSFWAMLFLTFALGILVLVLSRLSGERRQLWVLGLIIILMSSAVFQLLPLIRGYQIYGRDDALTHIGWTKDILAQGIVGKGDMYPIEHILAATILTISDFPVFRIASYIPLAFSFLFILFYSCFARTLASSKRDWLWVLVYATIPCFGNVHLIFAPWNQSFLFMPIMLYSYIKSSRMGKCYSEFVIVVVVMELSLVFFHPLTLLAVLGILILIDGSIRKSNNNRHGREAGAPNRSAKRVIAIGLALFFVWQMYAYLLVRSLQRVYLWLGGEAISSEYGTYLGLATRAGISIGQLVILILNAYGQYIVIGLFSLVCIISLSRIRRGERSLLQLLGLRGFMIFAALSGLALVSSYEYGFARILSLAVLFSILLISDFFAFPSNESHLLRLVRMSRTTVACLLVLAVLYFSIFNLYMSPKIRIENGQVCNSELYGIETFFADRETSVPITRIGISEPRFFDAIYGTGTQKVSLNSISAIPPDHFGYRWNESLAQSYGQDTYLLITDSGRRFYESIYPDFESSWRFTSDDFSMLSLDSGVQLIQTNGNLDVFLITPG